LRLDTTGKLAALLTAVELHGLGLSYFQDYPKAITAVTKDDVLRVAQKYLHPDAYALVVVAKQAEAQIDSEAVLGKK
jgi:zinc protease